MNHLITLIDGEEMNRQHPATFEIPTKTERENLLRRMFAKIGFTQEGTEGAERMWVQVAGTTESGGYYGVLNNDPVLITVIKCGDTVEFEPRHVLGILEA